jgi:hypothetical protein
MRVKQRTLSMHFISVFTQGGQEEFFLCARRKEEKRRKREKEEEGEEGGGEEREKGKGEKKGSPPPLFPSSRSLHPTICSTRFAFAAIMKVEPRPL